MLHDWVFIDVALCWKTRELALRVRDPASAKHEIRASELCELNVTMFQAWGPSESINDVTGPVPVSDSLQSMELEMQSGDRIKVTAGRIESETVDLHTVPSKKAGRSPE